MRQLQKSDGWRNGYTRRMLHETKPPQVLLKAASGFFALRHVVELERPDSSNKAQDPT